MPKQDDTLSLERLKQAIEQTKKLMEEWHKLSLAALLETS